MTMFVPGPLPAIQVADTVAARLQELPLLGPGLTAQTLSKIVLSLVVVLIIMITRRAVLRVIDRRVEERSSVYRWSKVSSYTAFIVGVFLILPIWMNAIRSVGTFLGLLSAGVAIALKDIVADLAGWVFIIWRRPFDLGDRIQIGGHAGDVVDTRIFAFTIMEIGEWVAADQSTGRIIHIPNASVFTQPLANYTTSFPFLWNELPVLVTFESDWQRAKGILAEIVEEQTRGVSKEAARTLKETSKRFLIHYRKLTPVVYTSVQDSGVLLTVRYLCRPRERRGSTEVLWERILEAFQGASDIDFAYPTHRVQVDPLGEKSGTRPELPPLSSGGDTP
jgi:small-conductance mechanosensitive channel